MSFDLKSVELFVRVASLGAIGKAGAEFGLSPTAATQRIQLLEHTVGAQLLHRTTRAVSLSSDGEVFLGHAQRIMADVENALSDVQSGPQSIRGELRVAGSAAFGRRFIAPFMAEFLEMYPNVTCQLHLSDAVFDIVDNGYDMAIRLGSLPPSTLKARKLAYSHRVLVAAPSYLQKRGIPTTIEELKTHECLIRSNMRSWTLQTPDGEAKEFKICGRFSTNLAEAVSEAALSGLGIARKCHWEVAEHIASGELVTVMDDHVNLPEWEVFAIRPPSRMQPAKVRAFTSFIEEKYHSIASLAPRERLLQSIRH